MKNHRKKILLVLCIIICALGMTACGKEKKTVEYDENELQAISEVMVSLVSSRNAEQIPQFMKLDPQEVEDMFKNQTGILVDGAAFQSGLENFSKAAESMGEFQEITGYTYKPDNDKVVVNVGITGEKKTASVEIVYDKRMKITSITTNVKYSFGELMEKAALNTLLGMGTVFLVLIVMSLVISCFRFIPDIEKKFSKKKEDDVVAEAAADRAVAQIAEKEELSDDGELVAVISAAIAAYESENGGSADGFMVRSIKKSNQWRRA